MNIPATSDTAPADTPPRAAERGAQFGQGGQEPYAERLSRGRGRLILRPAGPDHGTGAGASPGQATALRLDVHAWSATATAGERSLLRSLRGPILDVGCGPGRMLAAAREAGLASMGVDPSATAVHLAGSRGASVFHASIFDPIPHEGGWGSALLLDGNIGIGGNVRALLSRIGSLLAEEGTILVEVDRRTDLDVSYPAVLEDGAGRRSAVFPWAGVGAGALARHADRAGLLVAGSRTLQGRVFLTLTSR